MSWNSINCGADILQVLLIFISSIFSSFIDYQALTLAVSVSAPVAEVRYYFLLPRQLYTEFQFTVPLTQFTTTYQLIRKSGKKQALQSLLRTSSRGIGCGNTIYWNRMKPVNLPQEVLEAVNVTVDDIQLVPETIADRGWMDTISSVLQRFGSSIVVGLGL